jgi:hypothetical protein
LFMALALSAALKRCLWRDAGGSNHRLAHGARFRLALRVFTASVLGNRYELQKVSPQRTQRNAERELNSKSLAAATRRDILSGTLRAFLCDPLCPLWCILFRVEITARRDRGVSVSLSAGSLGDCYRRDPRDDRPSLARRVSLVMSQSCGIVMSFV